MKVVNKSKVELIDSMGTDLTVCNAARVSFDKQSDWEWEENDEVVFYEDRSYSVYPKHKLSAKDTKLLGYLAKHNHWSPFAHTSIQLRVTAPIFVARQLVKHQVGGVWNEVSRRYVDDEPAFYVPKEWRGKPINAKQGSDGVVADQTETATLVSWYALDGYNALLRNGVAPEQARMILPQNMMTSWYWTGSLMFFHRVFRQRTDSHAQTETAEVAHEIGDICKKLYPVSWAALSGVGSDS